MYIFLKIQELSNLIFFKCIFSAIISLSHYCYYYVILFKNFKYINIYFIVDPNSMNGMKHTLLTYQRLKWQLRSILLCFFKDLLITLSLTLFLVSTTRLFLARLKTETVIEQFGSVYYTSQWFGFYIHQLFTAQFQQFGSVHMNHFFSSIWFSSVFSLN